MEKEVIIAIISALPDIVKSMNDLTQWGLFCILAITLPNVYMFTHRHDKSESVVKWVHEKAKTRKKPRGKKTNRRKRSNRKEAV